MGHAQIKIRTQVCSRTVNVRSKQAALTRNVSGKELNDPLHYLVLRRESGPWFVGPPVVVLCVCHLNVLTELDDLTLLQLVNRRTETQLPSKQQHHYIYSMNVNIGLCHRFNTKVCYLSES